ncbi:MAG: hypothetical protein Q4F45_04085 [Alistipes sp.]|nr:hypothetical protein [Alistipes sp.]
MKTLLTRHLLLLCSLLCVLFCATSCESEEFLYHEETVPETKYKTVSTGGPMYEHNVYTEPTTKSERAFGLGSDFEVYIYDTVYQGNKMWLNIQVPHFESGWIRSNKITSFESVKTVRVKHTPTEVMAAAEQPLAGAFAEFYEWTHTLWDSTDYLHWLNMAIILIVYLVALIQYCSIDSRKDLSYWWEYVLMFIAGAIAIVMWLTSDLFEDGCSFDILWLDIVFGLMAIALPLPYAFVIFGLLYDTVVDIFEEPEDWIATHAGASVVLFVPVAACFWWFKSYMDIAIISYLVVQALFFLILLITSLINKQIMPFFKYLVCFLMLGVPFMIMTLISAGMVVTILVACAIIFGIASADVSPREIVGFKILDQFGRTVDTTDRWGHSSTSGRDYDVP